MLNAMSHAISFLAKVMAAFYERINSPSSTGGAFFGVCRGKVSEGLDFADANGRAVIITGLPYPPRGEPKVLRHVHVVD